MTMTTKTGRCFSLVVAIEVVLAIVALVGDQMVATAIFIADGPNGDQNARPNRIKLILKILIGWNLVTSAGGGFLLVLEFIHMLKGQKCGTLVHFKILLAAGIVCFARFFGVLFYYVIAILNQDSSNVSNRAPSMFSLSMGRSIVWYSRR
ncbi:unnamed protein product [Cuscuta epithymum]|uniref:Uncharacterized protein n=1 Tax=Cuscuta epithymum TaxID=186058 RepID=A0AAV0DE83_9ASTE|nr:unnamed protein product [Cuscuta epithymum]